MDGGGGGLCTERRERRDADENFEFNERRYATDLIGKTDSPIRLSKRPTSLASHSNTRAVTIPVLERRTLGTEKK